MRIFELLREMTYGQAQQVFLRLGIDTTGLGGQQLKAARNRLITKHHPDLNGDPEIAKSINAAYDVLSGKSAPQPNARPNSNTRTNSGPQAGTGGRAETPAWAWAGHSGGMPPSANIFRENYTDMNYIKKRMWELSGHSKQEWTILGYDGSFFRNSLTVYGSPAIFPEMAHAMFDWQTKGGNPYRCRAVFVQKRGGHPIYLIYCDDIVFKDPPVIEHESFNANPGNDQQLVRRLPHMLDAAVAAYERGEDPEEAMYRG